MILGKHHSDFLKSFIKLQKTNSKFFKMYQNFSEISLELKLIGFKLFKGIF